MQLYNWQTQPVGVTLGGLEHYSLDTGSLRSIDAQMSTAKSWGVNTIRLQIVQDELVGVGGHRFNVAYLYDIEDVVAYGRSLGLDMVLNDQTEPAPHYHANEGMPTHATRVFWRDMVAVYANVPLVSFDLFNEPRHASWQTWRVTFQHLVNRIRRHADNPIWLEGEKYASTCQGMPRLHGADLVYTFHHPGAPWPGMAPDNAWTWDQAFGRLAQANTPVVDGEFTDNPHSYHLPSRVVRAYLSYDRSHHIGMIVYGMSHKLIREYERGK